MVLTNDGNDPGLRGKYPSVWGGGSLRRTNQVAAKVKSAAELLGVVLRLAPARAR